MSLVLAISLTLTAWSTLTLWLSTHGTAKRAQWAAVTGFASQGLWLYFDWLTGAYGLMPLALTYGTLYTRGYLNWRTVARNECREPRKAAR